MFVSRAGNGAKATIVRRVRYCEGEWAEIEGERFTIEDQGFELAR